METTTIRKLFADQDRKFKIPAYQRAYSWEKENIEQFIKDLREASQDYYLGHFLFEQNNEKTTLNSTANTLLIIDGQQRLTTCIIFFSSLYEELIKKKEDVGSIDLEDIIHIYLRDCRKHTQKLETVCDDNNFFAEEIIDRNHSLRPVTTKSQIRIRNAKLIFSEVFSKTSLKELEHWYHLISDANCTEFRVAGKIESARIFAFQNDRGRRLSDLEVLKSYFMLQVYLHSESPDIMSENLHYLESEISTIYRQIVRVEQKEDDVLRYCWQANSDSTGFDTRNTVDEIKAYISAGPSKEICARIKAFISALAKSFQLVEKIETSAATDVENLRYLNNMALAYPFLIRAWIHGSTEELIERLARLLENITFRALLRGGRAGIESRLNSCLKLHADDQYVEKVIQKVVEALRNNGWWNFWSDQEVQGLLDNGFFYKNRVDNYILWRYELYLCFKNNYSRPLKVSFENLIGNESIEHIAPQTESSGGPIANGYGVYEDKEHPENGIVSGEWLNCLGNLMLISQSHNSSLGNKPFKTKLASYGKDNLLNQQKEISQFVSDQTNPVWDKAAIERRQIEIQNVAKILWSLDNL